MPTTIAAAIAAFAVILLGEYKEPLLVEVKITWLKTKCFQSFPFRVRVHRSAALG
jgi:hypothetical protein